MKNPNTHLIAMSGCGRKDEDEIYTEDERRLERRT
jgi:hypothetical protein